MTQTVAIITPAYKAQSTLAATVRSVLDQSHADWQHWIVADDGFDYAAFLVEQGLNDPRQVFLTSGGVGRGAPPRLRPAAVPHRADGLQAGRGERGRGAQGTVLGGDGRFDPTMSNMTDLEFLLQLYRTIPESFHLGDPLHDYIKRDGSMSNAKDVTAGMITSKQEIHRRLLGGHYGLSEEDIAGLVGFLNVSIQAEAAFGAAMAARSGLLFEDHLEPMLAAARR